jgi:hypothetical protein
MLGLVLVGGYFVSSKLTGWAFKALDHQPSPDGVDTDKYLKVSALGKDFKFETDDFTKYMVSRAASLEKLKRSIPALGKKLDESGLTKAQAEYELAVNFLNQLIEKIPREYQAGDIINVMKEEIDKAIKQINDQMKIDDTFFNAQPPLSDDQDKALTAYKSAQTEQLKAFDKSTAEIQTKLTQAATLEMNRINSLAFIYEQNNYMKDQLSELAKLEGARLYIGADEKGIPNLGLIEIGKLDKILSRTGKEITHANDEFKLNMDSAIWNPSYYIFESNVKHDIELLVMAVKATKSSTITMNVDFDNDDLQKKRARQAYQACIDAGFDTKNITIKIKNQPQTEKQLAELFKDIRGLPVKSPSEQPSDSTTKYKSQAELKIALAELKAKGISPTNSPPTTTAATGPSS